MPLRVLLLAVLLFVSASVRAQTTPRTDLGAEVIYEMFVRNFTPEGTFDAALARLPELRHLGVTTVWLMPIYPVGEERRKGTLGSPYAVQDFFGVNPEFGDEERFRRFVAEAHAHGMKVILDFVANHTAWDNPWMEAHPDWYTRNDSGHVVPPVADWYDVADLDYDAPGLREEMKRALRYWVEEFGVDGYRCDVAEMVPLDFWQEAIAELHTVKPVLMLAEGQAPGLHEAGFDLTYDWELYHAMKRVFREGASAREIAHSLEASRESHPEGAYRLRFSTNHDETAWDAPPVALFGNEAGARAAFSIVALSPGIPLVYNGQENGSAAKTGLFEREPLDWTPDPEMLGAHRDLLALRRLFPALQGADFDMSETTDDVLVIKRPGPPPFEGVSGFINVRNRAVPRPDGAGEGMLAPYEVVIGVLGEVQLN